MGSGAEERSGAPTGALTDEEANVLAWLEGGIGKRPLFRCLQGLAPLGRVGGWLGLSAVYAVKTGRATVTCDRRIVGQLELRAGRLEPDRRLRRWCEGRGGSAAAVAGELTHRLARHALEVLWPAVQAAEDALDALPISDLALDLARLLARRGGEELPMRDLARITRSPAHHVRRALDELRGRGLVERPRPGRSTLRWVDLVVLAGSFPSSRHEAPR